MASDKVLLELIRTHAEVQTRIQDSVSRLSSDTAANFSGLKAELERANSLLERIVASTDSTAEGIQEADAQIEIQTAKLQSLLDESEKIVKTQDTIQDGVRFSKDTLVFPNKVHTFLKKPIGAIVFAVACFGLISSVVIGTAELYSACEWAYGKFVAHHQNNATHRYVAPTGTNTNAGANTESSR